MDLFKCIENIGSACMMQKLYLRPVSDTSSNILISPVRLLNKAWEVYESKLDTGIEWERQLIVHAHGGQHGALAAAAAVRAGRHCRANTAVLEWELNHARRRDCHPHSNTGLE